MFKFILLSMVIASCNPGQLIQSAPAESATIPSQMVLQHFADHHKSTHFTDRTQHFSEHHNSVLVEDLYKKVFGPFKPGLSIAKVRKHTIGLFGLVKFIAQIFGIYLCLVSLPSFGFAIYPWALVVFNVLKLWSIPLLYFNSLAGSVVASTLDIDPLPNAFANEMIKEVEAGKKLVSNNEVISSCLQKISKDLLFQRNAKGRVTMSRHSKLTMARTVIKAIEVSSELEGLRKKTEYKRAKTRNHRGFFCKKPSVIL